MEISLVSRDHPDESVLEEYVFGRLSDPQTAALEEHLLICAPCQAALAQTDEYIRLMKLAASRPLEVHRHRGGRRPAFAAAGALAACIAFFSWVRLHTQPVPVTLMSFRGGASVLANQASAGHPLDLTISAADVPPAAHYGLEMVSSTGEPIWSGPARAANGRLSAHVARSLSAGRYWVRLYAQPAELLAEYGLQVK